MAVRVEKPIQGPTYTYNNKEDKYYESIGGVNPEWEMSERDVQAYRQSGGNMKTSAQQAYERMLAQQRAARQAEYDLGRKTLSTNANEAARQAYGQYMQSQRNLPSQMAAAGLTGGASESALLGLETNYGETKAGIQNTLQGGLNQLQAQYEQGVAMDTAQAQQMIAQLAEQQRQEQLAYQRQLEQWNREDQLRKQSMADKMAYAQWERSLGGTPTAAKPNLTAKQAQDAWADGIRTSGVTNAMAFYYGDDFVNGSQNSQLNSALRPYLEQIGMFNSQAAAQQYINSLGLSPEALQALTQYNRNR